MSFPRHAEIFPSDGGASQAANAPAHRLDEFPAGYSLAGWSPPVPASASPAGHQYAVMSSCRSRLFHRTANCVLTVCVTPGGKRRPVVLVPPATKTSPFGSSVALCSARAVVMLPVMVHLPVAGL